MQIKQAVEISGTGVVARTAVNQPATRRTTYFTVAILVVAVLLGLAARLYRLDASGLSEDEVHKIFAVRIYEHRDFTVNAEHPMLMKMLCFASLHLSSIWNAAVHNRSG